MFLACCTSQNFQACSTAGDSAFDKFLLRAAAKTDTNVAASFSFGQGAGTPLFGAGSGFGGAGGVMASVSTPTFGTLGLATTGVSNTAAAAAPAAAATTDDGISLVRSALELL